MRWKLSLANGKGYFLGITLTGKQLLITALMIASGCVAAGESAQQSFEGSARLLRGTAPDARVASNLLPI